MLNPKLVLSLLRGAQASVLLPGMSQAAIADLSSEGSASSSQTAIEIEVNDLDHRASEPMLMADNDNDEDYDTNNDYDANRA